MTTPRIKRNSHALLCTIISVVSIAAGAAVFAADSPQFRGPNRDGKYAETGLVKQWPAGGPPLAWSVEGLGRGWSSMSVVGETVYVTGMDDADQGQLFAFDLNGNRKWKVSYGPETVVGKRPGARTTPTVDGERLYLMSGEGRLVCLKTKDGGEVFAVDTFKEFGGRQTKWGMAESPLIDGDRVVCTPGGQDASLVALDKRTGKAVWTTKGLSEISTFCSANIFQMEGRRLIVTGLKGFIVGIDADTGATLWKHPFKNRYGVKPITPVVSDGVLFATTGVRGGSIGLDISKDGSKVAPRWKNTDLDCQHHGVVVVDGHVYGTAQMTRKGLVCVELATGETKWNAKEVGQGVTVYADGMLYVYSDTGVVRLVKPDPSGFKPAGQFEVKQGTNEHWAHPVVAKGRLFIRHGDALMAYNVAP